MRRQALYDAPSFMIDGDHIEHAGPYAGAHPEPENRARNCSSPVRSALSPPATVHCRRPTS